MHLKMHNLLLTFNSSFEKCFTAFLPVVKDLFKLSFYKKIFKYGLKYPAGCAVFNSVMHNCLAIFLIEVVYMKPSGIRAF